MTFELLFTVLYSLPLAEQPFILIYLLTFHTETSLTDDHIILGADRDNIHV